MERITEKTPLRSNQKKVNFHVISGVMKGLIDQDEISDEELKEIVKILCYGLLK